MHRAVEAAVPGVLRVLHALGMVGDDLPTPAPHPVECRSSTWIRAPRGGIFRLESHLGASVRKGDRLGIVTDPVSHGGAPVVSAHEGVLIGHAVNPLVHQGNGLIHVGHVAPAGAETLEDPRP